MKLPGRILPILILSAVLLHLVGCRKESAEEDKVDYKLLKDMQIKSPLEQESKLIRKVFRLVH